MVFAAVPAAAQISIEPAPPPSPEEVAAARTEADRLIAQADAADLFENVSEGRDPRVRHTRSGLICRFTLNSPGSAITVFPSPLPRGDDVGCNVDAGGAARTVYATRFGDYGVTPEQAISLADYQIRQRLPDARPFEGMLATSSVEGASPTLVAAFTFGEGYTQALVAHVGPWSIKERLTLPSAPSMDEQVLNAMLWSLLLSGVVAAEAD